MDDDKAVMMLAADLYDRRHAWGETRAEVNPAVAALLAPWRIMRVA